jgi:hypothetical protein
MQLQIQYIAAKLTPHVYVPEEPGEFHAHEAAGCHQEGGESHHVLSKRALHITGPFQGQNCINQELCKSTYAFGVILCGAHCTSVINSKAKFSILVKLFQYCMTKNSLFSCFAKH